MIRYDGQLKNFKFNCKNSMQHGKRVKKCLDVFTFDIEVTSAWDVDGKLTTYVTGFPAEHWNNADKYALPWIWQFSVNDTVYYGRELEEFLLVLNDIPADIFILIYVHNLPYEFAFLCNILTMTDVFARAPHKPMKCKCEEFPNVEFRCSYILTGLSLDQWGKEIGFKKLTGTLDYNLMRTPLTPVFDFELDYAEFDCLVVYHGILEHLKTYKDVWDIPLTNTGKVRRLAKKILTRDKDYMRQVKRLIPRSAEEYARFRKVFAGGYTHGNRKYVGKVVEDCELFHLDVASYYPTTMCCGKVPYSKWWYKGKTLPDPDLFEDYAFIMELHFTNIEAVTWNTYISASKTHGHGYVYDNGRVLAARELYYTCTEQDFITICKVYKWDNLECLSVWCAKKMFLPKPFISFVLDLYGQKTEYKNREGYEISYNLAKVHLNSMYGCQVTAVFNSDVYFDQNNDMEPWSIDLLTPDMVEEGLEKLRMWYNNKYFLSYASGCWITAICRRRLFDAILSIDADCIYCDTDSLFYKNKHDFSWFNKQSDDALREMCKQYNIDFKRTRPKDVEGIRHPLGHLEPDKPKGVKPGDKFEAFKTLGAKKYIERWNGKLYMTVAGINKGCVKSLKSIDDFEDGHIFDKDDPNVNKLEHTYLTDMKPIKWPDGYYSTFTSGINMRPTGYKLSIPNIYDKMENILNGFVDVSENYEIYRRGHF